MTKDRREAPIEALVPVDDVGEYGTATCLVACQRRILQLDLGFVSLRSSGRCSARLVGNSLDEGPKRVEGRLGASPEGVRRCHLGHHKIPLTQACESSIPQVCEGDLAESVAFHRVRTAITVSRVREESPCYTSLDQD